VNDYAPELKQDLLDRLRRIEGQARGVQHMIEEQRECKDVLLQIMAIRSATYRTGLQLVRHSALECLHDPQRTPDEAIGDLVDILAKMPY